MISKNSSVSTTYVRRLGPHHFAHLRAVAEGIPIEESAERYLGIEHGHQAPTAHRQVVDAVRTISRRRGDKAWRLIGLTIQAGIGDGNKPTIEEFIDERGLDGWSESEVAEMYAEAYPADAKAQRRQRLRQKQIELIRQLEGLVAELPKATDMVDGWFEDSIAKRMIAAGLINLGELATLVARGGRWYRVLPGVGVGKAQRIEAHLWAMLDRANFVAKPVFAAAIAKPVANPVARFSLTREGDGEKGIDGVQILELDRANISGSIQTRGLIEARTDQEAVNAWIRARAGSAATAKTYNREGSRILLWLAHERAGKSLAQVNTEDCLAYMTFLQHIPERWISRRKAKPGEAGWAPFRGQLTQSSYKQAVTIVSQLFAWLQSAQYLSANPWLLVNKKTGDDKKADLLDSKAFSKSTLNELLRVVDESLPSPGRFRMQFLLRFLPATGIRSTELLNAKLGDVRLSDDGAWVMQVHGKGAKNRLVIVPGQAYDALQEYLHRRGLGDIQSAPPEAPVLSSTKDPMEPVGYQALYQTVKSWIKNAIRESDLPSAERSKAARASTHWMRHTFGTMAVQAEVPLDAIQAQMGHASINTTMNIYGKAPLKRRADEIGRAFG